MPTTYYADYVNGSDSNNGLGPDASDGTNKPFKTLAKLLGGSGVMVSGDTAYLAPGSFRETLGVGITSPTSETIIAGDPQNLRGFKTSGGVLVAPGPVTHTAYTTNDTTGPSSSNLLDLGGRDFLTFRNIQFVCRETAIYCVSNDSTNITFTDCAFLGTGTGSNNELLKVVFSTAIPWHWLFERCYFWGMNNNSRNILIQPVKHGSADYDIDLVFKNCAIYCGIYATVSGGSSFKPGGPLIYNCFIHHMNGGNCLYTDNPGWSTSIPWVVENCFILTNGTALQADTSGQIIEDYNIIHAGAARASVSAGAHSIADRTYATLLNFGQERIWGESRRPYGSIQKGAAALLGFNASGNVLDTDMENKPRPAGGLGQPGGYGRGDTWKKEVTTVHGGSYGLSITGPGYQDFDVAVDAVETTVAVWMRYDGTYAGTKPKVAVTRGLECGVSDASSSAVSAADTWEQVSVTFTPTSKGVVTIRLLSTDTNGGGKAFADDLTIAVA